MIEQTSFASDEPAESSFGNRTPAAPSTLSLLAFAGLAVLAILVFRGLRPPPTPQRRAAALLEELAEHLRELSGPPLRRASKFAAHQAHQVGARAHRGEVRVEGFLQQVNRSLRNLLP